MYALQSFKAPCASGGVGKQLIYELHVILFWLMQAKELGAQTSTYSVLTPFLALLITTHTDSIVSTLYLSEFYASSLRITSLALLHFLIISIWRILGKLSVGFALQLETLRRRAWHILTLLTNGAIRKILFSRWPSRCSIWIGYPPNPDSNH